MLTSGRSSDAALVGGARYTFRLAERLTATAQAAFPELEATELTTGTELRGRLRDRSALLSILERLDLLGMTLLEFHRVRDRDADADAGRPLG
jgi:hypothetical protein